MESMDTPAGSTFEAILPAIWWSANETTNRRRRLIKRDSRRCDLVAKWIANCETPNDSESNELSIVTQSAIGARLVSREMYHDRRAILSRRAWQWKFVLRLIRKCAAPEGFVKLRGIESTFSQTINSPREFICALADASPRPIKYSWLRPACAPPRISKIRGAKYRTSLFKKYR